MTAVNTPLKVEQGTTWTHGWAVTVDGAPIDDTWSVHAQVRRGRSSTAALLHEWTSPDGGASVSVGEDAVSAVVLALDPADSTAWAWRSGYYDVEISKAGVTLRVAEGLIRVTPEVTA